MSLPDEVRAKYISIIDEILADADLSTISAKRVRQGIQAKVEYDITPHKQAINDLVGERFDVAQVKQSSAEKPVPSVEAADSLPTPVPDSTPKTNGVHKSSDHAVPVPSPSSSPVKREASDDDLSDVIDVAPPKKKRKASAGEDDAAIAARLQAEEDRKARPTRGGATRRSGAVKKKKTPKKKTQARITGSDDSDVESEEKPKKPQSNTGFHKPLNLSHQLSALLSGESQLSRPQVTKQLWAHIKSNNLQDPSDKRYIFCDQPMQEVFKLERVHMFQMTKIVNQHMFNPDE